MMIGTGQANRKNRYAKACCPPCGNPLICQRSGCDNPLIRQRSTRRFCSNACRQSRYRRRRTQYIHHRRPAPSRFAHIVRPEVSLREAQVRQISLREARQVIERREPMCGVATHAFGLFIDSSTLPSSVVVFGPHPASNLSPRHDQTICLLRGHTQDEAPKNCASKLIRGAMKQLPANYKSVVAFSDPAVGENGRIYLGAGFSRLGPSVGGHRVLVHFQGRVLSERGARREFGTASAVAIAKRGLKVEIVARRERWIATRADQAPQRRRR